MSKWLLIILGVLICVSGCETPGTGLGIREFDDILEQDSDVVCLDDGFDKRCILIIPGPAGKDGKDGVDGKDGESIVGPPGLPGRDGETKVIHVTEFRYVDVPIPEPIPASDVSDVPIPEPIPASDVSDVPVPEPIPASDISPAPKRVVAEAIVHPSGSVHPIPAETTHAADQVVHVSHLTEARHTQIPNDSDIWHIAIYDTGDGVDLYVYPRSLPPNDRLDFHEGEGTELQGTRAGVNELLRMFLAEHNTHIASVVGDATILE